MLKAGHGLILCAAALMMIGVVMIHSAGLEVNPEQSPDLIGILLSKYMLLAALALGALALASRIDVRQLGLRRGLTSPAPWIVLVTVGVLALVFVPGIGRNVNGATRWIDLGPVRFQPSEVAKWGVLIVLAWHASRRSGAMGKLFAGFVPPMLYVLLICGLIAVEDLGTAVLVGVVSTAVLIAAGARARHAAALLPIAAVGFVAAVIASPYRFTRLKAFLDPYADPEGTGYHIIQSVSAVSGGGMAGRGLGNSVQKFGYLPEDTTDFIFAIVCEEMGVIGAAVIVFLYIGILLFGLSIIRRMNHPFPRLLGLGVLMTIGLQALINIAVVTGAAPTKGIALPLVSAGGSGWVMTAFSLGLLVAMERQADREEREADTASLSNT